VAFGDPAATMLVGSAGRRVHFRRKVVADE